MSDSQFPGAASDAFPGDAGGGASGIFGDITAPTAPTVSASVVSAGATVTVTLALTPGTDPDDTQSVLTYNIYRDGAKIASGVTVSTWSETVTANGTIHSYTASMSDPAGNEGPTASPAVSVVWYVVFGTSLVFITIQAGGVG